MALTFKEKELANIGASVATGCKPCIDYHFKKVRQAGASDGEIEDAISDALAVRDSARAIMESHGLSQLGITRRHDDSGITPDTSRIKELVSLAAAFSVNCTTNLENHVAAAHAVGIADDEMRSVLDAAQFIKGEASHYVGQIVELEQRNLRLQEVLEELQQTQAQLVQSEKMAALGKLVAGVVHELNTPIGALNTALDVAARSTESIVGALEKSGAVNEEGQRQQLRDSAESLRNISPVSRQASRRISEMIASLKSFARLDEAPLQMFDLHETLDTTLTLMEHAFIGRVRVVKEYGEIPEVMGSPGELNQVWMNLFSNASQAIQGTGTITVRTYAQKENVCVEITDTGAGIAPERVDHLFEPRFSSHGKRVKAGMGLFISYNIIRKHRGQVGVSSELGKGSTFTVTLQQDFRKLPAEKQKSAIPLQSAEARCDRLEQ